MNADDEATEPTPQELFKSWGGSIELKATFVNKPLLKALVKESKRRKEQANNDDQTQ
jgi:hypothetical protein